MNVEVQHPLVSDETEAVKQTPPPKWHCYACGLTGFELHQSGKVECLNCGCISVVVRCSLERKS